MVLSMLERVTFRQRDFSEEPDGSCACGAVVRRRVAEQAHDWHRAVWPWMERVSALLTGGPVAISSTRRLARIRPPRINSMPYSRVKPTCVLCGLDLPASDRKVCDGCLPEYERQSVNRFVRSGQARIAELRERRQDPTTGGTATERRQRNASMSRRRWAGWVGPSLDPESYRRDILPGLQVVPLSRIAAACDVSLSWAGRIRSGQRLPHARHLAALRELGTLEADPGSA
jgi:hypothetical protein